MKTKHLTLLRSCALMVFMLYSFNAFSQDFCHTRSDVPNFLQTIPKDRYIETDENDTYVVRIYFHIIRKTDGTGGQTLSALDTGFNMMKSVFEPHGICFDLLGIDEIWDDDAYNKTNFISDATGNGKFENFSPNSHSNAIDIYIFLGLIDGGAGMAAGIPSSAFALGGLTPKNENLLKTNYLSHEIGHCLGLYHTFQGWCDKNGCRELADGSNCDICGDYVCDTPIYCIIPPDNLLE